jgi:hypothetical protein
MSDTRIEMLPEAQFYLWLLAAAPAIWMLHFLLSYITAAIWCARFAGQTGSLDGVLDAISCYTLLALVGIALIGWSGMRRHRHIVATEAHDSDTPEDRHRFLGLATLLLSALSAVATLIVALSASFFRVCS